MINGQWNFCPEAAWSIFPYLGRRGIWTALGLVACTHCQELFSTTLAGRHGGESFNCPSVSDTSVACDLTELTPLVPPCSHKWFTIDWHERLPVKWSMVSTCGCTSKGVCQKDGTEQNSCYQMQKKNIQCTACCIVVTVTGNCLFVMAATLAPSSVQSDLDKPTTCLYCIKT